MVMLPISRMQMALPLSPPPSSLSNNPSAYIILQRDPNSCLPSRMTALQPHSGPSEIRAGNKRGE